MLYKPKKCYSMWDTWAYHHDGTYYLYYLTMGPTERQGWHGQGVAMATSQDGVHWDEIGVILPKDDGATGLGTGSVWTAEDFEQTGKFIMNYSTWFEWAIQSQSIRFAESTDLIHWTKLGPDGDFAADPTWYETWPEFENARWDCIYTIPRPGGGRYGYWTALPKDRPGFGFGETLNGAAWTALEPPVIEGTGQGECGAIELIGGKYYMLYHGGGQTLVADGPQGPFRPVAKNGCLLSGSAYFTRFFPIPGALLVNHHSMPRGNAVGDGICCFAPFKRADLDEEGALRLAWWEGNDKLKGECVNVGALAESDGLARMFANSFDVSAGTVLEGTLPLTSQFCEPTNALNEIPRFVMDDATSGLYVEHGDGEGTYLVVGANGVCEIGIARSGGSLLKCECRIDREMQIAETAAFRLLLRDSMLELYLDDVLIQVHSIPARATGRIGLIGERAAGLAPQSKAWTFSPS